MDQIYITDAKGTQLPLTDTPDPRAAFHFAKVGTITHGTVWRCDEIHGRHMRHRLTFSSYYADSSISSIRTMGFLLYDQMLRHEGVAEWEASLQAAETGRGRAGGRVNAAGVVQRGTRSDVTHRRWPAFALLEALISLALIIGLSAVAYALVTPASLDGAVSTEVAHLNALVDAVYGTFASDVDFAGLDQQQVNVSEFPTNASAFGQPFTVLPAAIKRPADTWQAVYTSAPSGICARLVSAELASDRWDAILVGGAVVPLASSAPAACADPKTQDSTGAHELRFVRAYTGARHVSSGLPPICWDHTREQVIASGPPVGCPTDPAAYNSASR